MYSFEFTNQFKKDYKLAVKRNLKMNLLEETLSLLQATGELPSKYKAHKLSGDFNNFWECHIQPDWLLIWDFVKAENVIVLIRTGTHSDLF